MKTRGLLLALALLLSLVGCNPGGSSAPKASGGKEEAKVRAALDKLPAEDRRLAEEQKFCAVESENRLGSMGMPYKIMLKDQPVFLCCKGCEKQARANPDQTLAKVKALKETAAAPRGQ
jgi:hypothetical protein